MYYFEEKKHQKRWARAAVFSTAILWIIVGIWGCYWGLQGANLHTVEELEYSGTLTAYSIMFMLALFLSSAYSFIIIRKPKKQWRIRSYTGLCYFWSVVFIAIAIMAPKYTNEGA